MGCLTQRCCALSRVGAFSCENNADGQFPAARGLRSKEGPGGTQWGGAHYHTSGDEEASLGSSGALDPRRWADGDPQAAFEEREEACEDEGVDTDVEPDRAEATCIQMMHEGRVVWPPPGTVNGSEW